MAYRSQLQPGDAAEAGIVLDDGRYLLQLRDDKEVVEPRLLTRFEFDLVPMGLKRICRAFFEVRLPAAIVSSLQLGEGSAFESFKREQVLTLPPLTPYDAFALWFHVNDFQLHA